MGANSLPLVNQKLAYARTLLQLLPSGTQDTSLQAHALTDAAATQLVCAFQHYLREIAENYRLKMSGLIAPEQALVVITEQALAAAFAESDNAAPTEVQELLWLRADPASWLTCLHAYTAQQWAAAKPLTPPAEPQITDENLIQLTTIEEKSGTETGTSADVSAWCDAFYEMIQRHRQNMSEY
jgi:hypothetical protein